ncbi:MAG: dynamin family protein [Muribaculum sp.]|nr:dynamin family protein [Muribaculum sp.]
MSTNNEFLKIRKLIDTAVGEYERTFEECHIKEKWHSESIKRKSSPFLNGCFTLAIVGKMSSGKSTFINTLIGEDLLPTGHFQTTSAITYIEYSGKPKMEVTFCDGHKQTFEGTSLKDTLKKLVSVAPEYNSLPVNHINDLIAGGDTLEEVLSKKFEIEQKTKMNSSEELWVKYFQEHPKSTLAEKVYIYYPLSGEFIGWRIVDTPGIGAIGGIQDETKKLFAQRDSHGSKIVDAIIFLQRGDDNIQDSTNVEFVENTFKQLTSEAKERLFFVLTHATTPKFRQKRGEIIAMAKEIYATQYNIPSERLTHVDSLMSRFHHDLLSKNADVKAFDPEENDIDPFIGWDIDEWECMLDLISPIKKELRHRGLARNNENMLELMEEWGNFHTLKKIINDFVRKVKDDSAKEIISLIQGDYVSIVAKIKEEIKLIEGGEKAIKNKREDIKKKRIEYNNILNRLRRAADTATILDKFSFVDSEIAGLSEKKSIDEVRVTYQNIIDKGLKREKEIFANLKNDFNSFCKDFDDSDIVLDQIDFDDLLNQAHNSSTHSEDVYKTESYRTGGMSPKTKTRRVYAGTKNVTDQQKKLKDFKALVITEARRIRDSFKAQIKAKVVHLCDYVAFDIDKKTKELETRLDELEKSLNSKEEEIMTLNSYLNILQPLIKKIPQ